VLARLAESEQRCEEFAKQTECSKKAMEKRFAQLTSELSKQTMLTARAGEEKMRAESEKEKQKHLCKAAEKSARAADRRAFTALATADAQRKAADAQRKAADRSKQARGKRVSADGTGRPLHRVQVASRAGGGKRMALDEVHTGTPGSLMVRTGGGLQYRLPEFVFAFRLDVFAGIASRKTLGSREEANMLCRAQVEGATVHVVQHARPGTRMRRSAPQGPVQVFARPSNATMAKVVRPMFRMLLHRAARQLLTSADTVVLMTDGKAFKARHACGVLASLYSMKRGAKTDAFGNCPETRTVVRIPLQLQMQANKIADNQQTPFHVVRAFVLAGLESVLLEYRDILSITADAAVDNRGLGSFKGTMDTMAGKNSLLESILVSGRVWRMVDEDLKRLGVGDVLVQFNEGDEGELRKLTSNLYALRMAERDVRQVINNQNNIRKAMEEAAAANLLQATPAGAPSSGLMIPAPTPAAADSSPANDGGGSEEVPYEVQGNQGVGLTIGEGGSSSASAAPKPCPMSVVPAGERTSDGPAGNAGPTAGTPGTGGSIGDGLLASAKLRVEKANAKLDADAAAFAARHRSGGGAVVHSNEESNPDPIQLDCTGPLYQVPATVKRIHHLYENERLTSALNRPKLLRFWMQLWYCNAQESIHLNVEANFLAKKAMRTLDPHISMVALRIRKLRLNRFYAQGEALAGPTWQLLISKMLVNRDLKKFQSFHVFKEKLLLRVRRDPSNDKVVSMPQSASRFFPLYDQRPDPGGELRYNGHGQQCSNHAANNITDPCTRHLDHELLDKLIQAIRCAKSMFNEDELMVAIDHLLNERPEFRRIDEFNEFYRLAREGITAQALAGKGLSLPEARKEMGYTDEKGAQRAETCAVVRWSTTTKAADWMASQKLGYAAGFLIIGAVALDPKDEVAAVVAVFSFKGFRALDFPKLMVEKKVSESFELLTGSRTLFQLFLVAFLHRFIFKPLMALMGADNACGDLMGGAAGIPRRMLAALRRGFFVGGKWSRRLAYGHRTNGAEYTLSKGSVCLLNPKCGDKVSMMLGDGWDGPILSAIRRDMVEAIPVLVDRMRSLARKQDPIMPQDAERVFQGLGSMAAVFADPARDTSFALRMVQMQFLAMEVILDTATSLEYAVRHGLQGVRTFIAGMTRTSWTHGEVCCTELTPEGLRCPAMSQINFAHPMALADGVITLKLCEEIMHELKEKLSEVRKNSSADQALQDRLEDKDPLDFLPAFVAGTFGPAGQEDIRRWLGVSKTIGELWGDHYNRVDSLVVDSNGSVLPRIDPNVRPTVQPPRRRLVQLQKELSDLDSSEWTQALHRGFHPWWLRKNASIFRSYWNQVAELPKPLQAFPAAYGPSRKASNMAASSKDMERYWACPALMFETRSGLSNPTLSHFYMLPAFRDPALDPESLVDATQQYVIRAAQEMAQFGRLRATFEVDKVKLSVMKEAAKRKLAEKALRGRTGTWAGTNIGGEYRRPLHADLDPNQAKGKAGLRRLGRKTNAFLARRAAGRLGATVTIQKPAPCARASLQQLVARALSRSKPAQRISTARTVRKRRGKGNAANSASDSDTDYIPEDKSRLVAPGMGQSEPADSEAPRRSTRRRGGARGGGTGTGTGTSLSSAGVSDGRPGAAGIVEGGDSDDSIDKLSRSLLPDLPCEGAGPAAGGRAGEASGSGDGGPGAGDVGRLGGGGLGAGSRGAGGGGLGAGGGGDSDDSDDSEDLDQPLVPCGKSRKTPTSLKPAKRASDKGRSAKRIRNAAAPESDGDDETLLGLNSRQETQAISDEVWSIDFAAACAHLAWYQSNRGPNVPMHVWLMKEKDTAVFNLIDGKTLEVTIARRASPYLKNLICMKKKHRSWPAEVLEDTVDIKFDVRANSGRNYYLMYHDYAGVVIIKLESIVKPEENKDFYEDKKWAKTMTFRRVFETQDALAKAKNQNDNGIYMGEKAMREVWRKEFEDKQAPTVHEGDCVYEGDIRTLVGVARWIKEGMNDLSKDYFSEYQRADLLETGGSVCQNPKK